MDKDLKMINLPVRLLCYQRHTALVPLPMEAHHPHWHTGHHLLPLPLAPVILHQTAVDRE